MTCDEARESLWPDPDAASDPAARAHYDGCVGCRRFFVWQFRLGDRLAALPRTGASAVLRARVRLRTNAVHRARRRRPLWIGLAAAAALAVGWLTLAPEGPAAPFAPAARHLAALPMDSVVPDRMEASVMLSAELAMPLVLPDIEGADFMGANLVDVDGTMWAGARYRFKGMTVAYFALPMDDMDGDTTMSWGRKGRWEVAVWAEPDGMRAIAGEVPLTRNDVMTLAADCRNKAAMMRGLRS